MKMQQQSSRVTEIQLLWGSWSTLLNRFYDDPKVQMISTRVGQYLSSHPFSALAVMLFGSMAALPVGLFFSFALVTIIMSVVGFVFFEVFLLFVGGLSLVCVLSGIASFSVMVSFIFKVLYITLTNIRNVYFPHLMKQGKVKETKSDSETSAQKEIH